MTRSSPQIQRKMEIYLGRTCSGSRQTSPLEPNVVLLAFLTPNPSFLPHCWLHYRSENRQVANILLVHFQVRKKYSQAVCRPIPGSVPGGRGLVTGLVRVEGRKCLDTCACKLNSYNITQIKEQNKYPAAGLKKLFCEV